MRSLAALGLGAALLPVLAGADEASRRTPVVKAVERTAPAVVNISTERIVVQTLRDPFVDPFFESFFGRVAPPTRKVRTTSLGSGVFVDPDGYLLTNEHVIRKASKINVTLSDGTALEAELIAADRAADLALCRVKSSGPMACVSLDTVAPLLIGETAIALGDPFGLENTVTVGVISAKNRSLMNDGQVAYKDLIQTDASINPGNSGGPLLNLDGDLIGINTAVYSEAEGIGFAIPVSRVRQVLAEMLDPARRGGGWLGFRLDVAEEAGGPARLVLAQVQPDGPAARAGLKTGDKVTAIDGRFHGGFFGALKMLAAVRPGDTVTLSVLGSGSARPVAVKAAAPPRPTPERLIRTRLGLTVERLTPEQAAALDLELDRGCIVTEVAAGGVAAAAGLAPGDVILRLGRQAVQDPESLAQALEGIATGADAALQVVRRNRVYVTTLRPDAP